MKPGPRLLQNALRLTLFTHEHCSLCLNVKTTMSKVWNRRPFDYQEIDILASDNAKWKSLYQNDIPVVHVEKLIDVVAQNGQTSAAARKLKHRMNETELESVMDNVERS